MCLCPHVPLQWHRRPQKVRGENLAVISKVRGEQHESPCGDGGTSEVVYENRLDHFKATIKAPQF